MTRCWIVWFGLLALTGVASARAGTVHPDLRAHLRAIAPEAEVAVIVTLAAQQDLHRFAARDKQQRRRQLNQALRAKAETSQRPLRHFLEQAGARDIKSFWIFNGMAATIPAAAVAELAGRPEVLSIRPDRTLRLAPPLPAREAVPEWNLRAINVPSLWAMGATGSGVVVAAMDTGVDPAHPDLAGRWRGGGNSWFDPHGVYSLPHDSNGHGTQTMGVMVGGDAGGSAIGVAPGARWIAVKLYDDAGVTTDSAIHQGFQWLLDPDGDPSTDDLPDVVNNSWGYEGLVDPCFIEFQPDVQALKAAGVAVVFAAGNSGPGAVSNVSPANYPESYGVGAADANLVVAFASSRGPSACDGTIFPEIVAPGVNVRTADLSLGGTSPDPYASVSGTSIAAPHAAGAMALLLSVRPQLTVAELEQALSSSALDLGAPGPDNDYGNGFLDVAAANDALRTFRWSLFMQIFRPGKIGGGGQALTTAADDDNVPEMRKP